MKLSFINGGEIKKILKFEVTFIFRRLCETRPICLLYMTCSVALWLGGRFRGLFPGWAMEIVPLDKLLCTCVPLHVREEMDTATGLGDRFAIGWYPVIRGVEIFHQIHFIL